ncbi:hypothetical protein ACGFYQ_05775 [Streptomyces sp. NPDC048258]
MFRIRQRAELTERVDVLAGAVVREVERLRAIEERLGEPGDD